MTTKSDVSKIKLAKYAISFSTFLLLFWGLYRLLFQLPENIEELLIKPIVWLIPVWYLLKKEKARPVSLGITTKNLRQAFLMSLGLGVLFMAEALIVNYFKYGSINIIFNQGRSIFGIALAVSLATSISEEVAFRGYIFNRMWQAFGNELFANIISTVIWTLIHIPITIFVWKLPSSDALIYLLMTGLFGFGSSFVFARTKNIISSILLHLLWAWPIILFR